MKHILESLFCSVIFLDISKFILFCNIGIRWKHMEDFLRSVNKAFTLRWSRCAKSKALDDSHYIFYELTAVENITLPRDPKQEFFFVPLYQTPVWSGANSSYRLMGFRTFLHCQLTPGETVLSIFYLPPRPTLPLSGSFSGLCCLA